MKCDKSLLQQKKPQRFLSILQKLTIDVLFTESVRGEKIYIFIDF